MNTFKKAPFHDTFSSFQNGKLVCMDLPYALDALQPKMSQETVSFHYLKHHQGYVHNVNRLMEESQDPWPENFVELIKMAHLKKNVAISNNAQQVWNHDMAWHTLTPVSRSESLRQDMVQKEWPIFKELCKNFGTLEGFEEKFCNQAVKHFASGWVWLVLKKGQISITTTANAATPWVQEDGVFPLMTLDVWEHAYYLDHQNLRSRYAENWLKLIDWNFVQENFEYFSKFEND